MLFQKKHNKRIKVVWGFFSVLIAISMVLLYAAPALIQ